MKVSPYLLPVFVIVALIGGYGLRTAFTQPSTRTGDVDLSGTTCTAIVTGLKCKGTATFFTSLYEGINGISSIETFATEHKAVFTYDTDVISRDSIRVVMEQIVTFDDGTSYQFFECQSIE